MYKQQRNKNITDMESNEEPELVPESTDDKLVINVEKGVEMNEVYIYTYIYLSI